MNIWDMQALTGVRVLERPILQGHTRPLSSRLARRSQVEIHGAATASSRPRGPPPQFASQPKQAKPDPRMAYPEAAAVLDALCAKATRHRQLSAATARRLGVDRALCARHRIGCASLSGCGRAPVRERAAHDINYRRSAACFRCGAQGSPREGKDPLALRL